MKVKHEIPFNVGMFEDDYIQTIRRAKSPKDFLVRKVTHGFANQFVLHHHYLRRKIYIARNVSYGIFSSDYCIGVCMFGFPVWRQYPGLVPPMESSECPELIRLCTMSNLPRNTESWFVGKCLRQLVSDWNQEVGVQPKCVTSLCDNALGFDGAIYKACNFTFHRKTKGRSSNPGGTHGKWRKNDHKQDAEKTMWVYFYEKKIVSVTDITGGERLSTLVEDCEVLRSLEDGGSIPPTSTN